MKSLLLVLLLAIAVQAQAVVSAPIMDVAPRQEFTVPIDISDSEGTFAYDIYLKYNRKVINPVGENFGCSAVADSLQVNCNAADGVMRVSAYSSVPIHGDVVLFNIRFQATNKIQCSELVFDLLEVYTPGINTPVKSVSIDGLVCITP